MGEEGGRDNSLDIFNRGARLNSNFMAAEQ